MWKTLWKMWKTPVVIHFRNVENRQYDTQSEAFRPKFALCATYG